MKSLVALRLSNSETVIGTVVDENEEQTTLFNPVTLKYMWDELPPTIYATPYAPLQYDDNVVAFNRRQIVSVFKPSEKLIEYYENTLDGIQNSDDEDAEQYDDTDAFLDAQSAFGIDDDGKVH